MTSRHSFLQSIREIKNSLKNHDLYRENYEWMLKLPLVQSLIEENLLLKKQNKSLGKRVNALESARTEAVDLTVSDDEDVVSSEDVNIQVEDSVHSCPVVPPLAENLPLPKHDDPIEETEEVNNDTDSGNNIEYELEVTTGTQTEVTLPPVSEGCSDTMDVDEEESYEEIEINGKRYYKSNTGIIHEVDEDDEIGNEVGKFVDGVAVLDSNNSEMAVDKHVEEVEAEEPEEPEEPVEEVEEVEVVEKEEVEEEVEEVEEEVVEEEEVEVEVEEEVEEEEEEEEELEELEMDGNRYYVPSSGNGNVYSVDAEDEVGDVVGKMTNGVVSFTNK